MSTTDPLIVARFDVAMEPAIEEEPILTIGAIAEDGRPVALLLDLEARTKVADWLAPDHAEEVARLHAKEAELSNVIAGTGLALFEEEQENARLRLAWRSARERAQAYGEGILRHVEERDSHAGWLKAAEGEAQKWRAALGHEMGRRRQAEEEINRLRAERHSTNEALSDVVEQLRVTNDRLAELEPYAPTGHDPVEDIQYEVVGDWGVDGADTAEKALAFVRKALQTYPHCGARAQQRTVRTWDDGSEWYGPWTEVPGPETPTPPRQQEDMGPGKRRLAERTMAELEATHWKRLGITPPPRQLEDQHDGPLHQRFETCRDFPTAT